MPIKIQNDLPARKILEDENIKISATCIRVPVLNCHGVLVKAKLKKAFYIEDIKSIFKKTKGIIVLEEPIMFLTYKDKEKLIIQLVDMEELKDENKRLRESLDRIKNIK